MKIDYEATVKKIPRMTLTDALATLFIFLSLLVLVFGVAMGFTWLVYICLPGDPDCARECCLALSPAEAP